MRQNESKDGVRNSKRRLRDAVHTQCALTLFHSDVSSESGLRNDESVLSHHLQRKLVGNDRAVSMRDVREGA